jgi:hypothetical protein
MEIIDPSHPDAQLGANVQGKENPFGFFCKKCTIYHKCKPLVAGDLHNNWYTDHDAPALCKTKELAKGYGCIPNRCSECNNECNSWIRTQNWKKKLRESFSFRRHRFIRMLTLGLPGQKIFHADEIEKQSEVFRLQLIENFKKLRARKIWKDCIDGGMWFYEYTLDIVEGGVKINPHLHMVVLASKMVPIKEMNDYIEQSGFYSETKGIQLGRIHVSVTRDKKGRIKKTSASDAINYCCNYLKKDTQSNGRNRQTFGNQFKSPGQSSVGT